MNCPYPRAAVQVAALVIVCGLGGVPGAPAAAQGVPADGPATVWNSTPSGSAPRPAAPSTSETAGPAAGTEHAAPGRVEGTPGGLLSLAFRDASLPEVFEMLSRRERINVLLGKGVSGTVSINLYNVTVRQAIREVAEAAGYTVELRNGDYVVLDRKEAGLDAADANTRVRSFKVQYSDPKVVAELLGKHLSRYGKITPLIERRVLLVEDLPEFLERTARLLREIDQAPRQILIEAKILEIALDHNETFGIDWSRVFSAAGTSNFGTRGLATGTPTAPSTGFFFSLVNQNLNLYLSALSAKGRVRTLSTPRLLALENQEATTKIGNNIGYSVTTTINNVSTQTIQFLETGVILRFLASVDESGRVVMKIHPEVSSGSLQAGIPSKNTTEVTTQLVAEDGQSVLIGGLLSSTVTHNANGVPVLSAVPVFGQLFSSNEEDVRRSETVVLITPHVIASNPPDAAPEVREQVQEVERTSLHLSTQLLGTQAGALEGAEPAP